jgi:phenylalanyl-tRNA synthetase beta chain
MRVPYTWLKDYVDIDLDPEELAQRLTMAGLEVDRVDYPWPGIQTAEIVWLQRIAGSDHLSATRIWTGEEELSVVCGASNIKLHDKVPLARLGAKVGDIAIGEKTTMGVRSQGMLCSPRELGVSDDHAGILILPPDTPVGLPLGKVLGDAVIELDIKANRGDLFCMVGIAREVAAFTGRELKPPRVHLREKGTPAAKLMRLEVRAPDLCPRYTARVVRDVKLGLSPQWMAERLIAAGMRPINNVVDITNYVMLELGQPLHAFDYDKVAEHTIIVRRAEPGETLTTLDDVTRQLTPDMLLITDPAGPNVIAGIFGGARVEVGEGTTSVLLEAAHFNPISIRRTSAALGLRTESSGRFEKNPDISLTTEAIDRAAQLLAELAGGTVAPGRVDFYPEPISARHLPFRLGQIEFLTGMRVTRTEAVDALRALGFSVTEPDDAVSDVVEVGVPTWRDDIEEGADLVEEVARIVGYDRIPSLLPEGPLPPMAASTWFDREEGVRDILIGAGLTEVVTYPLTNKTAMARLLAGAGTGDELLLEVPAEPSERAAGGGKARQAIAPANGRAVERRQLAAVAERLRVVTLLNPMSSEQDALRLTLMSSLLGVVRENSKHADTGLWFFELGRRYLPTAELIAGTGLPDERRTLGVALAGPLTRTWIEGVRDADYYDLKGIVETLLEGLRVEGYRFTPTQHPTFHPGRCAALEVAMAEGHAAQGAQSGALTEARSWASVAVLGEIHPEVAERFDLSGRVYLMELDLERLFLGVPEHLRSATIARFPAAQRDLAIVVGRDVPEAEVAAAIRGAGAELVRGVELFDVYTGAGIAEDKKSLAYALSYQSAERTLTDAEVERTQAAILDELGKRFGAVLRT